MSESAVNVGGTPPMAGDNAQEREARSRQADAPGNPGNAATKRNTTVVILCKTEVDARDLLEDLADDDRIVAAHVELGESKYLVVDRRG